MDLIGEIDLEKLEEELKSERLNFQDVASVISGLSVESPGEQVESDCFESK